MSSGLQQLGGAIVSVKDFISKSYMKQFTDPACSALRINNIDKVKILPSNPKQVIKSYDYNQIHNILKI